VKVGIISSDRKEWHISRLLKSFEKRGAEAYLLPVTKLLARIGGTPRFSVRGFGVDDYDTVIVRRVPGGTAEQVFYRMDALRRIEDMGVKVINPARSIEKAVDKYYTSALLEEAGINTPRTIVTESFSEAMRAFNELGGDVVVKPLFGSLGMGIARITNEDVAYRVFRALEMTKSVYYLQEFILVASMQRVSDDWKTNISSGGKAAPYTPSDEAVEMSLKASEKLGLMYTGVDIIETEDEAYVIELNSTPGWEGLQSVTDIDITEALIDHVMTKLR